MCIKYSKRHMVLIESTFYLILNPDDDLGDYDDEMPSVVSIDEQSKYFHLLESVFHFHLPPR